MAGKVRAGFGRQKFQDGSRYEGFWKNNVHHGVGRLIYANGNIFEG